MFIRYTDTVVTMAIWIHGKEVTQIPNREYAKGFLKRKILSTKSYYKNILVSIYVGGGRTPLVIFVIPCQYDLNVTYIEQAVY